MQDLIESIRAALAAGATTEHKAAGATACRTILAALDTVPGTPFAIPGAAAPSAGPRVSVDQVLDLMIARLTTIANEHDHRAQEAPQAVPPPAIAPPTTTKGIAPVATGLRIPKAAGIPIAAIRKPTSVKPAPRRVQTARKP